MSLENSKAIYGLSARGPLTAPGTSTSDRQLLGSPLTEVTFSDADIFQTVKAIATTNADSITLTFSTGAVGNTGSPTIEGAAVDFEGGTRGTMVTLYAVVVTLTSTTGSGIEMSCTNDSLPTFAESVAGETSVISAIFPTGLGSTLGTLQLTFSETANLAEINLIGKTT